MRFHLGQGLDGKSAGALSIKALEPVAALSTPATLHYSGERGDIEVIRDGSDDLLQILTPQVLVDVAVINSYKYEIRYYELSDVGSKSGDEYTVTGDPYVIWVVENPDASPTVYDTLLISKVLPGSPPDTVRMYEYEWDEGNLTWIQRMKDGSGNSKRETHRSYVVDAPNRTRTDTYLVKEVVSGTPTTVYQAVRTYYHYAWGYELIKSEVGTGADKMVTEYDYYGNYSATGKYKKLKWVKHPDGSWMMRDYDTEGRKTLEVVSSSDATMPSPISASSAKSFTYDYTSIGGSGDDDDIDPDEPRTITEKIGGIVVGKTYYAYYMDSGDKVVVMKRAASQSATYSDGGNLVTVTRYVPVQSSPYAPERIKSIVRPDGTKITYAYADGTYTPSSGAPGSWSGTGSAHVQITATQEGSGGPVTNKSTRSISVLDLAGQVLLSETYVYDGSGYQRIDWTVNEYDGQGRLTDTYRSNNYHVESTWADCCGQATMIDETGLKTQYAYDDLGRTTQMTKTGVSASGGYAEQASIVTTITRTANGTGLLETRAITSGPDSSTQYDLAGRVKTMTDEADLVTSYAYSKSSGADVVTITHPSDPGDAITEVREYYLDGRIKRVTGSARIHEYHEHGVNGDGSQWTKVFTGHASAGSVDSSPQWVKRTYNVLGQITQEERPGYNSGTVTTAYTYNNLGQPVKMTTTGQAPTLYEYDTLGRMVRSGLDVNTNDTLDLAGMDRITDSEADYVNESSEWWQRNTTKVYDVDNTNDPETVSVVKRRMTGFASGVMSETVSIDASGAETRTTVTVDRDDADRLVTTTTEHPGLTTSDYEQSISRNGLTQSRRTPTGVVTKYKYDALGRLEYVDDANHSADGQISYNSKGQVQWVKDAAAKQTSYVYDTYTGQITTITNHDGAAQYFAYDKRGKRTATWGDTTYPVSYVFDDFGRTTEMETWQTTGSADPTEPEDWLDEAPAGQMTRWVYEDATGLLLEKQYADHDPGGSPPKTRNIEYTYTTEGRLATRKWSRVHNGTRIVTSYGYASTTGDLATVTYGDDTPDVDLVYDRLGRPKTITQEFYYDPMTEYTLTHQYAYRSDDLFLATEQINFDLYGTFSKIITRDYETSGTGTRAGRSNGFRIGTSSMAPASDYTVGYSYDASRGYLKQLTGIGLPAGGVVYQPMLDATTPISDLISTYSYRDSSDDPLLTVTKQFEANRNLITEVENLDEVNAETHSQYAYAHDNLRRPSSVKYSGESFVNESQVHLFKWDYSPRSELDYAERCDGNDLEATCDHTGLSPYLFELNYDHIGNRDSHTLNGGTATEYSANTSNQYTSTTGPGAASYLYDEDGNLVQDDLYTYVWDAENRLITVNTRIDLGTDEEASDAGDIMLEFAYDYAGRRIAKWHAVHTGSYWDYSGRTDERYIYDGFNLVLVTGNSGNATMKFTWGLDLSGQGGLASSRGIHQAGGAGGLLSFLQVSGPDAGIYWYTYDANGNVAQLLKYTAAPDALSAAAHYEYDPYGNVILDAGSGNAHSLNRFRVGTMWLDAEPDAAHAMYYVAGAYYSPALGRPIQRTAFGANPYGKPSIDPSINPLAVGFVGNIGIAIGTAPAGCLMDCADWQRSVDRTANHVEDWVDEFGRATRKTALDGLGIALDGVAAAKSAARLASTVVVTTTAAGLLGLVFTMAEEPLEPGEEVPPFDYPEGVPGPPPLEIPLLPPVVIDPSLPKTLYPTDDWEDYDYLNDCDPDAPLGN